MPSQAATLAVCLLGPTATGKTELALELARRLPIDLISVDSAMVYRRMDIGSGKPPLPVLAAHPHRLVDIRDPWEQYSAGEFASDASTAIREIGGTSRTPLLVGGTFLYFRSLIQGLADLPRATPALRAELEQKALAKGWAALHEELAGVDPVAAARIDPADGQRIQRALEVHLLTGSPLSVLQKRCPPAQDLRFLKIGLLPRERLELHHRIAARTAGMLAQGFIAEVEGLLAMPQMDATRPALRAVGYRQICQWLDGQAGRDGLEARIVAATRQLAKRQLTWLRREHCDHWFEMGSPGLAADVEKAIRAAVPRMQYGV